MKIIIAGGGDVGFHLATLLSSEQQDITLVDVNQEILEQIDSSLDVKTILGDASSLDVLRQAEVNEAKLFLAVTTSEKDNLIAAILAKQMGAKRTVARVMNEEYLDAAQCEVFKKLGVDQLISPSQLAAEEISRLLKYQGVTDVFSFEEGKINLFGIYLQDRPDLVGRTLHEINQKYKDLNFRPVAILRGRETLLPESHLVLSKNDHIYFLADNQYREKLLPALGIEKGTYKKVMIVGGGPLGLLTAKILEADHQVTIIEESKAKCKNLINQLDDTLVIKGDPSDYALLRDEGLEQVDAFIALTPNSETNILGSLMASENGVKKTIALVDNVHYIHISQHIGVDTLINKKLIAANNIFRFVRKGKIEAIASLHGVQAEIIEFVIPNKSNQITTKPLCKLNLPAGAIIGTILRDTECIVPTPEFILQPDDRLIVLAMPEAIQKVESLFK